jgi:hypothetical protein
MGVKERPFCRFWIGPTVQHFEGHSQKQTLMNVLEPFQIEIIWNYVIRVMVAAVTQRKPLKSRFTFRNRCLILHSFVLRTSIQ